MQNDQKVYDAHIIILNWNGMADTIACISSLQQQEDVYLHITLVDNGSTDDSVEVIRNTFPNVHLIENGRNLGFAGGMNIGIHYVISIGAKFILIINNDTVTDKRMVRLLLEAMDVGVGIAAPAVFYESQPDRIWSVGGNIHPILLELLQPHGGLVRLPERLVERDFVTGCAMLVQADVFQQIGLFDERFSPAYYEDLDFCLRVRQKELKVIVVPEATLLHKVSQSSGGTSSPYVHYLMARNSAYYFRKHMGLWQMPFILVFRLASAVKTSIRFILQKNWESLTAYWTGLAEGWVGRAGKAGRRYAAYYQNR